MLEQCDADRYQQLAMERFGEPPEFLTTFLSGSVVALNSLRTEVSRTQDQAAHSWNIDRALERLSWSCFLINQYCLPMHEELSASQMANGRKIGAIETARVAARQAVVAAEVGGVETGSLEEFWWREAMDLAAHNPQISSVLAFERSILKARKGQHIEAQVIGARFQEVVWQQPTYSDNLARYAWWIVEAGLALGSSELTSYGWALFTEYSEKSGKKPSFALLLREKVRRSITSFVRKKPSVVVVESLLPLIPRGKNLSE